MTTKKTLKKRSCIGVVESLLLASTSAAYSLRPLHIGVAEGLPPKKSVCYIRYSEGGDQELDSGGPGVQIADDTKKAPNGKKASMSGYKEGGIYGGKKPEQTREVDQHGSGAYIGQHRAGARNERLPQDLLALDEIDDKAPLAELSRAHLASMALSDGRNFVGARR